MMITDVTSIDQQKKRALMEAVRLEFREELVAPLLGTHHPVFALDQSGAVMLWNARWGHNLVSQTCSSGFWGAAVCALAVTGTGRPVKTNRGTLVRVWFKCIEEP
eukprot:6911821-Pyramimonas_sp.AAC.1